MDYYIVPNNCVTVGNRGDGSCGRIVLSELMSSSPDVLCYQVTVLGNRRIVLFEGKDDLMDVTIPEDVI
ncbi:hypothetical protein ACM26V_15290 [Salipaludibacillus sp. HK11]|uniref:hypothetical protein n=1 Tax=Salipaludibacillus sp. HK11 TaxID=3394320 RepID=UPI0039FCCAB1